LEGFDLSILWQVAIIVNTPPYGSVSKPCTPVVHIKIAGKWMFIPLKMVLIGINPYPYVIQGGIDPILNQGFLWG